MPVTTRKVRQQLHQLYVYLKNEDEGKQSDKVLDIIDKISDQQMMIGFAGHFSAGKSTLINTLLESDLLPSSPIPTSANIVQLTSGPPYTVTHFHSESPVRYEGAIDFQTVQSFCKDGEEITGVEISRPIDGLPSNISILDTPGVDSTNDSDRLITESSLHVMDYMYYVMDYNHVQSEVNLHFLLEMQRRGTPFSVIINQVDKHVETELTFETFRTSVKNSLEQWGIVPDHVYFISLKDFSSPINSYRLLKHDFSRLFERPYESIERQAIIDAEEVIQERVQEKSRELDEDRHPLLDRIEILDETIERSSKSRETPSPTESSESHMREAEQTYKDRILSFIPNAYIMPSPLREDAKAYLESMQPDFKVGFLFTKKKTEEAIEEREQTFYDHLQRVIEKNMKWPLRDRLLELLNQYSITDDTLVQEIQQFSFAYDKNRLHENIESGASVTGNYILRYTDQVSKDVKQQIRTYLSSWRERIKALLEQKNQQEYQAHQSFYEAVEEKKEIQHQLADIIQVLDTYHDSLTEQLHQDVEDEEVEWQVENDRLERRRHIQIKQTYPNSWKEEAQKEVAVPSVERSEPSYSQGSVQQVMEKVNQVLPTIKGLDGMEQLALQLKEKRQRLGSRQFTVALFGAFSAGKSSFANAILGDQVLPVSPNPTTATINKISPPNEHYPNRTIQVRVKSEQQLLDDFSSIRNKLKVSCDSIKSFYQAVRTLSKQDWKVLDPKQYSFLQAFIEGFDVMATVLNQEVTIAWEDFSSYVAEEKKSCFIEWMELYYDCPWTRAGITLVDTPGADSVNARHTDVSFEYIKDADAVLFVTYYNHPFSKADQSFLTQLGRVKDTFAMDKMFFIINAADLATSEGEVEQVEKYLEEQLVSFQIRHPRLYSLSSLLGLKEKQMGTSENSGMRGFEEDFGRFLNEDLADVLKQSIIQDIENIKQTVTSYLEHAKLDSKEREEQLQQFNEESLLAGQLFEDYENERGKDTVQNKIEKQLHYVHERMMLNFNDFFKHHFNPATINGKEQDVRAQLMDANQGLMSEVDYEMKQELRAVSVRIERLLAELISQVQSDLETKLQRIRPSIQLSPLEWKEISVPDFDVSFAIEQKRTKSVLKQFKSTKAFFERNEKESMKDDLATMVSPALSQELNHAHMTLAHYYTDEWKKALERSLEEWREQTQALFDRLAYSLEHPPDADLLKETHEQLQRIT